MAELDANVAEANESTAVVNTEAGTSESNESAEIARLKRELAAQINKNDALAKENASQKKAIRAKQSAEEAAAEEKREADEAVQKELNDLRKRFAVSETAKKLMSFLGDDALSNSVAEYLYGAEDVDAAVDAFGKAWIAKEKKLRQEFGRIPSPGVGASDVSTITKEQLDKLSYMDRLKFAIEHPEEYNKLMGR